MLDFDRTGPRCYSTFFYLRHFREIKWSWSYKVQRVTRLTYTRGLIRFSNCVTFPIGTVCWFLHKICFFFTEKNDLCFYFSLNHIKSKLSVEVKSFTSASALVIYVSKLPLGACSIRACSISKLRKWIDC